MTHQTVITKFDGFQVATASGQPFGNISDVAVDLQLRPPESETIVRFVGQKCDGFFEPAHTDEDSLVGVCLRSGHIEICLQDQRQTDEKSKWLYLLKGISGSMKQWKRNEAMLLRFETNKTIQYFKAKLQEIFGARDRQVKMIEEESRE
jgi:hypothetical protein